MFEGHPTSRGLAGVQASQLYASVFAVAGSRRLSGICFARALRQLFVAVSVSLRGFRVQYN